MKIFYKYIVCLLVYLIPFIASASLAYKDGSYARRHHINLTKKICRAIPLSIAEWDKGSIDDILKDVLPSIMSARRHNWVKGRIAGCVKLNIKKNIRPKYSCQYVNIKNKISTTMTKIAKRELHGGHLAVARVILGDNDVFPLPYFFLSGSNVDTTCGKLGITDIPNKYFTNLSLQGMGVTCPLAFAHSERDIAAYLKSNLQNIMASSRIVRGIKKIKNRMKRLGYLVKRNLHQEVRKARKKAGTIFKIRKDARLQIKRERERAKEAHQLAQEVRNAEIMARNNIPITIQIKNALPMCHNCELLWQDKAYCDNNIFCTRGRGQIYNVLQSFPDGSSLRCSDISNTGVDAKSQKVLIFRKREEKTNDSNALVNQKIKGARKHTKIQKK